MNLKVLNNINSEEIVIKLLDIYKNAKNDNSPRLKSFTPSCDLCGIISFIKKNINQDVLNKWCLE